MSRALSTRHPEAEGVMVEGGCPLPLRRNWGSVLEIPHHLQVVSFPKKLFRHKVCHCWRRCLVLASASFTGASSRWPASQAKPCVSRRPFPHSSSSASW